MASVGLATSSGCCCVVCYRGLGPGAQGDAVTVASFSNHSRKSVFICFFSLSISPCTAFVSPGIGKHLIVTVTSVSLSFFLFHFFSCMFFSRLVEAVGEISFLFFFKKQMSKSLKNRIP